MKRLLGRLVDSLGRRLLAPHTAQLNALRKESENLRSQMRQLTERVDRLGATRKQIDKVLSNQKNDEKFRQVFRKQLASLIRAHYLPTDIPAPFNLQARRFRLRSQHEEDGIILALLHATGISRRRFLEIGCGGTGGNAAVLAQDMGWSGLMIDASPTAVKAAQREYRAFPDVTIVRALVTPENVNALVREHGIESEIDFLSIDVDSIDYWIFDALEACSARVVVLEYNGHFGSERAVTLPRTPPPAEKSSTYWGASLAALHKAAVRKGYRLVMCEETGVNAFFVREGLAPDLAGLSPEQAFRPFRHRIEDVKNMTTPSEVFKNLERDHLPLIEV